MSAATRSRLLDAALRSFATVGVEGTVITDLEEAAGLAPGSGGFYRYFRTKEEVLDAVVRREIERVRERESGSAEFEPPSDPREALRLEFATTLAGLRRIGPLIAILAREHGRIPELAAEITAELVEPGVRTDQGRDPSVGAVVLSALVGYHLSTDYFGGPPGGVDSEQFVATLAEVIGFADKALS